MASKTLLIQRSCATEIENETCDFANRQLLYLYKWLIDQQANRAADNQRLQQQQHFVVGCISMEDNFKAICDDFIAQVIGLSEAV